MEELLLDPKIRIWVFIPILMLTFLYGLIKHYVTLLIFSERTVDANQIQNSQTLMKSRILRENGKYVPREGFLRRKHYLIDDDGVLKKEQNHGPAPNPMTDPSMVSEMMKGNLMNMVPMLVIGGWINAAFSGFLTTKVPFPLTVRFKPMLQRDIHLTSLDASWVSSTSWYFLNFLGLRSMYSLILGENNSADQSKMMQDQMSGAAMAMPQDPQKAFKSEVEALTLTNHTWALEGVEEELVSARGN